MASAAATPESQRNAPAERRIWAWRFALLCALVGTLFAYWVSEKRRSALAPQSIASPVARPLDRYVAGRPLLGSPSLFSGIPGGPTLTIDDIRSWLDDPRNHEALDFELPLWLRDARDQLVLPVDDPLTRAKIELGRQLFMEGRLTEHGFHCVICHHPTQGYSRPTTFTFRKNPPPVFNRILSTRQFWDGRAATLEDQVEFPVRHQQEMNTTPEKCEQLLREIPGYRMQFERIYGTVTFENMSRAIAAFQRALLTGPGPYDFFRVQRDLEKRDPASLTAAERTMLDEARAGARSQPMSESALRGMELFFSDRTNCSVCHSGPNFTDEQFHNLGVGAGVVHLHEMGEYSLPDDGRMVVTGNPADYAAFKTPTLRNLSDTGAYFHDARSGTLEEAVEFIARGGAPNKNLSPLIRELDLASAEIDDLVAFLKSLEGELAVARTDRLPP